MCVMVEDAGRGFATGASLPIDPVRLVPRVLVPALMLLTLAGAGQGADFEGLVRENTWWRFQPGVRLVYETRIRYSSMRLTGETTIETQMTLLRNPHWPTPPPEASDPAAVIAPTEVLIRRTIHRTENGQELDPIVTEDVLPSGRTVDKVFRTVGYRVEPTSEFRETVDIGGLETEARVVGCRIVTNAGTQTRRYWLSDALPGGVLRCELEGGGGGGGAMDTESTTELISMDAVDLAPAPPARP